MITKKLIVCLFVCLGVCSYLAAQNKNLLKNSLYDEDIKIPGKFNSWELYPTVGWERKLYIILPPDEIPYFTRKISGNYYRIVQKNIPVEPNTWYVMTAWYRAEFTKPHYATNFRISAYVPGGKGNKLLGGTVMCGIGKWVKARAFVYTGKHSSVDFQTRFYLPPPP